MKHFYNCQCLINYKFFFFFSSRRRHTRCGRDWSSDVCSSDLDATLWFLHAVDRHVTLTGDTDLGVELLAALDGVVAAHVAGCRFNIGTDTDGLLTQGADGHALTWMDARVDGVAVTPRAGKPVEVNALWINGLA